MVKGKDLQWEIYILRKKDFVSACGYAREVIKGRWSEAEPLIAKDPLTAFSYAKYVIKGRWPEAEASIITDSTSAYWYAKHIIKGRWPEAEQYIIKDKEIWESYKLFLSCLGLDIDIWDSEDERSWNEN